MAVRQRFLLRIPRPLCGLLLYLRRTRCRTTTHACRNPEIQWHTTNQKTGLPTRALQYPSQHGGGGGFAVGTGYCQHMAALQYVFG